jgi:hypothetical protein
MKADQSNQQKGKRGVTKIMDLPYFLEMVDGKHRHGSHLRAYHAVWKESPSSENFFYWLDYGEGKDVEVPRCSREKLERDQVRYLSPEERLKYLVKVDDAGMFRWAKNDELVQTNSKRFKDSMQGVVHRVHSPLRHLLPHLHQELLPQRLLMTRKTMARNYRRGRIMS